jgi:hypothetical protein
VWLIQGLGGFLLTIGTILVLRAAWQSDVPAVSAPAKAPSPAEVSLHERPRRAA